MFSCCSDWQMSISRRNSSRVLGLFANRCLTICCTHQPQLHLFTYLDSSQVTSLDIDCFAHFRKRPCPKTTISNERWFRRLTCPGTDISRRPLQHCQSCHHSSHIASPYYRPSERCTAHRGSPAFQRGLTRSRHRAAGVVLSSASRH